jgi:cytidyltransferase-like protein
MIYCFDIDGTICTLTTNSQYDKAVPFPDVVSHINSLHDQGHIIKMFTARGCVSGHDWTEFTRQQLQTWGVKYTELITNSKPNFDLLVDDKAINASSWREEISKPYQHGFVAGSFDIIHPGYALLFKDAKKQCRILTCALHNDPSLERESKNKPIHSISERKTILEAIKYIDNVVEYSTETELEGLLTTLKPDIRILGSDYKHKRYTGDSLGIPVHWHSREHHWSASGLRELIASSEKDKIK